MSSQVTGVGVSNEGEFGANEWLVDELYEQFKIDRNSVDKAWWPVLEAYHPVDGTAATEATTGTGAPAAPAPTAQAPAASQAPV
uniref:2-oxoglutarate dehydrogenase E1 subunit family protein n=1 Tax=Microbacterium sp. CPCC 204701 TaxID=2493084 RepID=UPI001F0C3E18